MLARLLISPLFGALLLVVLLCFGRRGPRRWLRGLVAALLVLAYLLMTPLLAEPLLHALESQATGICRVPLPGTVVVLAGGADEVAARGEYAALNQASMRRVIAGVGLWRQLQPGAQLLFSGGGTGQQAESLLMAAMAKDLGVPAAAIRTEKYSHTTWQNARNLKRLQPAVPNRLWLVTSAVHMPRAMFAMRQAGFAACAVPVDFRYQRPYWLTAWLPSAAELAKSDAVLHELVGLLWYHLKGS